MKFPLLLFPPNHPLKNRVFHYFHHPFWGIYPYLWKHPKGTTWESFSNTGPPCNAELAPACAAIEEVNFTAWVMCEDIFHPILGKKWQSQRAKIWARYYRRLLQAACHILWQKAVVPNGKKHGHPHPHPRALSCGFAGSQASAQSVANLQPRHLRITSNPKHTGHPSMQPPFRTLGINLTQIK